MIKDQDNPFEKKMTELIGKLWANNDIRWNKRAREKHGRFCITVAEYPIVICQDETANKDVWLKILDRNGEGAILEDTRSIDLSDFWMQTLRALYKKARSQVMNSSKVLDELLDALNKM